VAAIEVNFAFASLWVIPPYMGMESTDEPDRVPEFPPKARRTVRIIYVVMAFMILLPFLLIWLMGAFRW